MTAPRCSHPDGRPYAPCSTGIHVCGIDEENNAFFTEANFAMPYGMAVVAFARLKDEVGEVGDGDFVVDLMCDGSTERDFFIRRQMLARLSEVCSRYQTELVS